MSDPDPDIEMSLRAISSTLGEILSALHHMIDLAENAQLETQYWRLEQDVERKASENA